jgi:TPP-dependent 2-oxoacid decarboxylase
MSAHRQPTMSSVLRQTDEITSGIAKPFSVADDIVERLGAEGIGHCFGVAGDYVFRLSMLVTTHGVGELSA